MSHRELFRHVTTAEFESAAERLRAAAARRAALEQRLGHDGKHPALWVRVCHDYAAAARDFSRLVETCIDSPDKTREVH